MSEIDPVAWQRAIAIADDLLDLDADARAARLAALPAGERAHVERLLAADAASGVLDRGVQAVAHTVLADLAGDTRDLDGDLAGHVIGAFQLERKLGRGGMGDVYLGVRTGGDVAQRVAVKVLRRGMDSADIVRRFARERRILAQLNHPNIARFVDGGFAADGRPYYAMDLVDGVPLGDHARMLDVRGKAALIADVCDAVAFAHARLVVHRDLKPSNILVDRDGRPFVLDFGIAKLLDADDDESTVGKRPMSPAYAAPEQITGAPIGVAADVYALGVVLYELIVGALPHARNAGSLEGLIRGLDAETAVAPSVALRRRGATEPATGTPGKLDGDLDLIVLRALKRDPDERYPSAAAFAGDLRAWLDHRPITARADSVAYRVGRFVRRHRVGVAAAAAGTLAIGAALAVALWQAGVARDEARRADAETRRALAQGARAETGERHAREVVDFMTSTLVEANPVTRSSTAPPTVIDVVKAAGARVDGELADQPAVEFAVRKSLANVAIASRDFDTGERYLTRALAIAAELHDASPAALAEAYQLMAALRVAQQRYDDAVGYARAGLGLIAPLRIAPPRDALLVAASLHAVLTETYFSLTRLDDAIAQNTAAIAAWRQLEGDDSLAVGRNLYNRSVLEWRARKLDDAAATMQESIAIHRKHLAATDFRMATLLSFAGKLELDRDHDPEALSLMREAIEIAAANPEQIEAHAGALLQLGDALKLQGKQGEARPVLEQARERARSLSTRRTEGLAERSLGDVARFDKRYVDAAAHHFRAAELFAQLGDAAGAMATMARVEAWYDRGLAGDPGGALARLTEIDPIAAKIFKPESKEVAMVRQYRGEFALATGRPRDAIALLRDAIALNEKTTGPKSTFTSRSRVALGLALRAAGDPADADAARAAIQTGLDDLTSRGFGWDRHAALARDALGTP